MKYLQFTPKNNFKRIRKVEKNYLVHKKNRKRASIYGRMYTRPVEGERTYIKKSPERSSNYRRCTLGPK